MKLEDQVCSLELSKRLKELGVRQESIWVWNNYDHKWDIDINTDSKYGLNSPDCISAFTVAELGEILRTHDKFYIPYLTSTNTGWISIASSEPDTEANARAKALIFSIENKLKEIKSGKDKSES